MKTTNKILTALVTLFIANQSQAQSTASADAFATVVTPIAISKAADLNFGNIAVQSTASGTGAAGGTVVLATGGSRTATGGVTLPAGTGTVSAASFTVTGEGSRTFAITLPASTTLTRLTGTETILVNNFNSDPATTSALSGGTKTVNVGATLNVLIDQAPGTYKGSFNVTVNYN
ncbi:MAG: DUF4402 domain-containing protein [Bacteroidota bacterium]|nr:DUF4402 domain-containing protein [Bacteroidota bacterium]